MTLPHLAGIFTSKQLAEPTREQLPAAGQPVTVHRVDLAKALSSPVTGDDGQPVILPPGPAACGLSGPGIPLLAVHRDLTKIIIGPFLKGEEKYGKAPVPCKALLFRRFRQRR